MDMSRTQAILDEAKAAESERRSTVNNGAWRPGFDMWRSADHVVGRPGARHIVRCVILEVAKGKFKTQWWLDDFRSSRKECEEVLVDPIAFDAKWA